MADTELQQYRAQPEILPPPSGDAGEALQRMKSAARGLRTNLMTIAYFGFRVRLGEWFRDYGFESEEEFREYLDIPRSTYYKAIRIGEALHELPYKDLVELSVGNAELLIQVQPTLWGDYPWVHEAQTLKADQFAELVAKRNRQSGIAIEPMTYVRWKVPFLAKQSMEQMVVAFQQKYGLASPAQALEFIIADKYDMPNLLANLEAVREQVKQAVDSIRWRRLRADNETAWLYEAMKRLDEMIRPLRNKDDDESNGEESPAAQSPTGDDEDDEGWAASLP